MSNATATKLNTGFINVPYKFLGEQRSARKPSRKRLYLESIIFSYQINEQTCKQGYSTFAEKLNCAKSSIALAVSKLSDKFTRTKKGMEKSAYEYTGNVNLESGSIRIEYIFFTEKFEIERRFYKKNEFLTLPNGKKRRVLLRAERNVRYLSDVEILCLSLIYSYSLDKKHGAFKGTVGEIAGKLDISVKAAEAAIAALISAELIFRHSKAVNGTTGEGKYVANLSKIRAMKRAEKKKAKKVTKATSFVSKEIEDANARADFAKREEEEKRRAERYQELMMNRARADARFDVVRSGLRNLVRPLAEAELKHSSDLPALEERKNALRREMSEILLRVGIDVGLFNFEDCSWRPWPGKLQT